MHLSIFLFMLLFIACSSSKQLFKRIGLDSSFEVGETHINKIISKVGKANSIVNHDDNSITFIYTFPQIKEILREELIYENIYFLTEDSIIVDYYYAKFTDI